MIIPEMVFAIIVVAVDGGGEGGEGGIFPI